MNPSILASKSELTEIRANKSEQNNISCVETSCRNIIQVPETWIKILCNEKVKKNQKVVSANRFRTLGIV